ncbi:MAG: hypothetical protein WCD81_10435 [Candidatus Bathyarchaeia archaeon]
MSEQKVFNPKEFAKESQALKEVYDPDMGLIRYRPLLFNDLAALEKAGTKAERSQLALFTMLKAGCLDLTLEQVGQFELRKAALLLKRIAGDLVPALREFGLE